MAARIVEFHRLAEADYLQTRRRYRREGGKQLEERFVQAIEVATQFIGQHAEPCPSVDSRFRWYLTPDFPFLLFFYIWDDSRVTAYALKHERQKPGTWRRRFLQP